MQGGMSMLAEREILAKFKKGGKIETAEERQILQRYAMTGMVKLGVNFETKKAEAILTKRGKWLLKRMD